MEIKTFSDLIDWTRQLHDHLAKCLSHGAVKQKEETARLLMEYLADHESQIARMVTRFEEQADSKAMHTYVYDYLTHKPIGINESCDVAFSELDYDGICREVFNFHEQVMDLYRSMLGKADTDSARDLLESLLAMEQHEAMRLATQTVRMHDL